MCSRRTANCCGLTVTYLSNSAASLLSDILFDTCKLPMTCLNFLSITQATRAPARKLTMTPSPQLPQSCACPRPSR